MRSLKITLPVVTLRVTILVTFAALSLCAQTSLVHEPQPAPKPERKPIFILPEQLSAAAILPSPAAPDSPQTAAEIAVLHKLEKTRSAAEIAHAKADDAEEDIFIFKNVLGEHFDRKSLPLTALFGDHVHNDESFIANPAKIFFHRTRPYQFDATLKPVCNTKKDPSDYSYPGGHAVSGYLEAFVTAMLVPKKPIPEKRDAILTRADDYAHSRLVCGVHYPSDLEASKDVAHAMIGLMMNHPQFKQEFEAAKAETRRALGLKDGGL